jgi:hypothetical protein
MGAHMKTTIEIPDALLEAARKLARRDRTTLRNLVELGLREVIARRRQASPFTLRDVSFGGQGLQRDLRNAGWERLREMAYEDRGG